MMVSYMYSVFINIVFFFISDKPAKCHHYSMGTMYVCKVILGDTKVC